MFPRKLSGFGGVVKSFSVFGLFAAVRILLLFAALRLCVRFLCLRVLCDLSVLGELNWATGTFDVVGPSQKGSDALVSPSSGTRFLDLLICQPN